MTAEDRKKKFADAVMVRLGKPKPEESDPDKDEDDDQDEESGSDDEAFKMAKAALKRDDSKAFCEAIRRITNS